MTVWLGRNVVVAIHETQLARHGGATGVRDEGLLESALARPLNLASYGEPDTAKLAAMYALGIARNHPFVDGNKRTAFGALLLFLSQNGLELEAAEAEAVVIMLSMASGDMIRRGVHYLGSGSRLAEGLTRRERGPHIPSMPDPFVIPEEPSAADAVAAIGEELEVFDDWMDRYQFIIELGRKLPPFPEPWMNDAHRVPGCQSRVWMEGALRDGKLFLAGISDAAIVSGLIALLLRVYSGRTPGGDRRHRPGVPQGAWPPGGAIDQPRQRRRRDGAQDTRIGRPAIRVSGGLPLSRVRL